MRGYTVVELRDELNRRIAAGQGRAPVALWVADTRDQDHNRDVRAGLSSVVAPDEQFPELQLWGNA